MIIERTQKKKQTDYTTKTNSHTMLSKLLGIVSTKSDNHFTQQPAGLPITDWLSLCRPITLNVKTILGADAVNYIVVCYGCVAWTTTTSITNTPDRLLLSDYLTIHTILVGITQNFDYSTSVRCYPDILCLIFLYCAIISFFIIVRKSIS